jgi:hypothetical protein
MLLIEKVKHDLPPGDFSTWLNQENQELSFFTVQQVSDSWSQPLKASMAH